VIDQLDGVLPRVLTQSRTSGSLKRIVEIELLWVTANNLTRVMGLVVEEKRSRHMNAAPWGATVKVLNAH
jgi:hypothetical protein